jgi:hypothetical protein
LQEKDQSIGITFFQLLQLTKQKCRPVSGDFPSIAAVKQIVAQQLDERTAYMRDDTLDNHSPVYIIAAYLTPSLMPYLAKNEQTLAERSIKIRMDMGSEM